MAQWGRVIPQHSPAAGTGLAQRARALFQVMQYGRSDRLGHVSFKHPRQDALPADKPYSKATAEVIDAEGRSLINCSYERALGQLMRHCDRVEQVREQGWGGQGLCCLRSSQGVCSDSEGLKGWEHS